MLFTIRSNWALLLGIGLLMLGHGLQNTLLGVRASIEGFPTSVTGIVMSGYSIGFLVSAIVTPRLVAHVGHVRVFAAFTALASSAILAHALLLEPISWFVLRFLTGVCMSGAYVVAESWLNRAATNEDRGSLLSVYMLVQLTAWAGGQLLLNAADPGGFRLFIGVSVLLSIAVVPMLLTASPAPATAAARSFGLIRLYRSSPLGFVGMFGVGLSQGAFFAMGAVFAGKIGLDVAGISLFMALAIVGGVLLQWPVGRLSDRLDRRRVVTGTTILAGLATGIVVIAGTGTFPVVAAAFFLYGGMCLPMYALCIAHTNDNLDAEDMVGASGTLVLVVGIGMVLGPPLAAAAMDLQGPVGFASFFTIVHLGIGAFALYRMTRRASVPMADQGQHIYAPQPSPVAVALVQETAIGQQEAKEQTEIVQSPLASPAGQGYN
ncbi:MAG: MFS transporter [Geminicoccaceae bacterium]|nr:MFS transporter [Geminicoccaceae bacterium]